MINIRYVMALHRYFKPISSKLPDPNGPLSKEMPSAAIREANKSVEKTRATEAQNSEKPSRGQYGRFTPTQAAQVAKYAVQHGNQAAIS